MLIASAYQNMTRWKQRNGGIEKSEEISVPLVSFYGKNSGMILYWINVNKVDSKKRKNYTDISNASFWLGVRPLLCE